MKKTTRKTSKVAKPAKAPASAKAAKPAKVAKAAKSVAPAKASPAKPAARKPRGKSRPEAPAQPTMREFAIEAARMLADDKCEDVVLLEVGKTNPMTDFIIIGSGTSDRQMRSVLKHVEELGLKMGHQSFRTSMDDRTTWIIADFLNLVVNLFEPATRAHYDLEMLWGDAPRIDWHRPAQARNRAGLTRGDGVFDG